jgi:hypothetical protein
VRDVLQVKGHRTVERGTAEPDVGLALEHLPDRTLKDILNRPGYCGGSNP